ncbi:hypothetical protein C9374_004538 [Naegleria lovaniensis]|uniref:Phosphoglycerate mutase family protein n=1 Tax=Naegleria lovaniensis TaxID=51637 RepID=A0AA88GQ29_NAELO|nr:uncharacterized protein C9374_004538 [Naegleria lovaniensis]KAG2383201.1 hypothetical protein C9374_004538 [Naegleria lovaniensis]
MNTKTIILVRHGQATHNLESIPWEEREQIRDPLLTPLGIEQAKQALIHRYSPSLIAVSPLQRTVQTCLYALHSNGEMEQKCCATNLQMTKCIATRFGNTKVVLQPLLQEENAGTLLCDTGVDVAELCEIYGNELFNLDYMCQESNCWYNPKHNLEERVKLLIQWLRDRERNVLL